MVDNKIKNQKEIKEDEIKSAKVDAIKRLIDKIEYLRWLNND